MKATEDRCEIAGLGVTGLLSAYRRKTLSPREVAAAVLECIAGLDQAVNAFCLVDPERTLEEARLSERRWMSGAPKGPLDGIPTSIKDLVLTAGWPTLRGSLTVSAEGDWGEDAPAVARLKESGALLIGKTTTCEFGWKGVTDSPRHGITRNPWNTERTPGGSSGGAAVAAALGLGVLHLGTDAGGSVRIPAGFTGVFGLKPTYGRVPAYPLSPFGTIAHLGPLTRRVEDAAWMMNAIARPDPRDGTALPQDAPDYRLSLARGVQGLRIAYSPTLGYARVDPEVAELVARAAAAFADLGAAVEEVESLFEDPLEQISILWEVGAARIGGALTQEQHDLLDRGLQDVMARGRRVTLDQYLDAITARQVLGRKMSLFHEEFDLLLTPSLPIPAFLAGQLVADSAQQSWLEWTPFSYPFNLTQQPACSVPCGLTRDGLPVGLQIVAARYRDDLVLRAAAAYEAAHPARMPVMPIVRHDRDAGGET